VIKTLYDKMPAVAGGIEFKPAEMEESWKTFLHIPEE
jgi:hypothetical protein